MIVVRSPATTIPSGLIVDSVSGLRGIAADTPVENVTADELADAFLSSLIECDGQSVAVLDLERLLLSNEMRQFQPA
jgi:chemotaxis signal transduction protein